MKRIPIVFAIAAALFIGGTASAGEKTVGLRAGYNTRCETAVAGVFFQYRFSSHVGIAPNVDYYFRHNNADALSMNVNMHFPFSTSITGRTAFYPLAGLNYTSWNYHPDASMTDDVSTRVSRMGINLGGGFEYYATPTLKLSVECKATLIKQYSSGTFNLSIGYVF